MKKIFVIAGEASGDALGAPLMRSLRERSPELIEFVGIGGPLMEAEDLESLLPMEELCVMGLWEVVAQLPRLLRLINGVVEEIEKHKPDVVLTIDLPDFNFRVAQRLKKRSNKAKIIHYVAPTVWAWRPGRAKKISKFLDGLMCLFPFEPEYFKLHGLKAEYVGHPIVETKAIEGAGEDFRREYNIPQSATVLGLFFGSRASELKIMSETLLDVALVLKEQCKDLHLIIPTLPHLEFQVINIVKSLDIPAFVVTSPDKKWDAFQACDFAVAVSGTVGLELAYAGVPHVIAYKTHPVSWLLIQQMVKVKYAHLANILLDEPAIPEFLQRQCHAINIAKELLKIQKMDELKQKQAQKTQELREKLNPGEGLSPSQKAADFVLKLSQGTQ